MRRPLVWLMILAVSWQSAAAQAVTGTVVDSSSKRPLGAVTVILRTKDSTVASTRTDSTGAFTVRAKNAGVYHLEIRRLGYDPLTIPDRPLANGETRPVRIALRMTAVGLDTVRSTSGQMTLFHITSGQEWFNKHVAEGKGIFFGGLEVLKSRRSACDFFAALPGLRYSSVESVYGILCVGRQLIVTAHNGTSCLSGQVDRFFIITGLDSADIYVRSRNVPGLDSTSFPIPFERIKGVEVFMDRDALPKDLGIPVPAHMTPLTDGNHGFGPKGTPGGLPSTRECAWIQVWTDIAW